MGRIRPVRFADDFLLLCQRRDDAERLMAAHVSCSFLAQVLKKELEDRIANIGSRGEAGAASIITPRSASPHMVSSYANERRFPPLTPGGAKRLAYPCVPNPEAPPIRPERHVENSIATVRRRLAVALARNLLRCPCCQAMRPQPPYRGSS